jgi:ribosomal protein L24
MGDFELAIGNEVTVVAGKYSGSVGIIAGSTPKMYYVELLERKIKVRLLKSSVEPLFFESQPQENECSSSWPNTIPPEEVWTRGTCQIRERKFSPNDSYPPERQNKPKISDSNLAISETVNIVHGKYTGKVGIVISFTAKMVYVQLQESTADTVRISKSNVSPFYFEAQSDENEIRSTRMMTNSPTDETSILAPLKPRFDRTDSGKDDNAESEERFLSTDYDTLAIGDEVDIVAGMYTGTTGIIKGLSQAMCDVLLNELMITVQVSRAILGPIFFESRSQENPFDSSRPTMNDNRETPTQGPRNIPSCEGAISNHSPSSRKYNASSAARASASSEHPVQCKVGNHRQRNSFELRSGPVVEQPLEIYVPMPDAVGGLRIETMRLAPPGKMIPRDRTFAGHHFKRRLLSCEIPLGSSKVTNGLMYSSRIVHNGCNYELLCSKLQKENSSGYAMSINSSKISLHFVCCDDSGWLQKELEEVADFAGLPSHKVASRLELFQTPAMKSKIKARELLILDDLSSQDFDCIPENSNEGCGFVPRGIIRRLLGNFTNGKRTFAIQVRIFAPKIGIFKGMLVERRGITKIQLPPSMLKVGRSQSPTAPDIAVMIVKGIFPGETTLQVGKVLNPCWKKPLPMSFQHVARLKLSPMITDLWESLAVPKSMIQSYKRSLKDVSEIRHSYLIGVADPTGIIPEGHIFVPGMGVAQGHLDKLFVTRCPCMVQEDGRLLPVLRSKPTGTDQLDWDFLNSFAFGAVIFGNSRPGFQALPTTIANGDLDGDLFFVCWHEEIVERIEALPFFLSKAMPASELDEATVRHSDWLSRAQGIACDLGAAADIDRLVGTLYSLSKKFARNSQDGAHDPAAVAFGKAYQASLDLKKHGGQVSLPSHLWVHLPPRFHKFVQ